MNQIVFQNSQVNCEWGEWEKEGDCSTTCGGGLQILTRKPEIESKHGGQECIGASNISEICNIQKCPGNESN